MMSMCMQVQPKANPLHVTQQLRGFRSPVAFPVVHFFCFPEVNNTREPLLPFSYGFSLKALLFFFLFKYFPLRILQCCPCM